MSNICYTCVTACIIGCGTADPEVVVPLWFGGDVHLGASPRGGFEGLGPKGIGVVNLEGPIGPGAGASALDGDRIVLVNPGGTASFLRQLGVGAITFENNHADDLGAEGQAGTLAEAEGAGLALAAPTASIRYEGVSVSILAVDLGRDTKLEGLVLDPAGGSEAQVVAFHVTGPPSYLPRPELEGAVEWALGQGADLVVSHGTHALARVERRGQAVIAWGLGNLWFDCPCTTEEEAMILEVELGRDRVGRAAVVPIRAGLGGEPARPAPDADGIHTLLEALGSPRLNRMETSAFF